MAQLQLRKDREDIHSKFDELIRKSERIIAEFEADGNGIIRSTDLYWEIRTSSLNLLSRLTSEDSFYVQELKNMERLNAYIMKGILVAAKNDFIQGFMVDNRLLVSAEIFADFLGQAEVLLENDYKDAAAVIIRSVLEDGLRRLCSSRSLEFKERAGIYDLAQILAKAQVLNSVQMKEIDAKKEIGNKAAHGKFNEFTKADVAAFLEFVQRFFATVLN